MGRLCSCRCSVLPTKYQPCRKLSTNERTNESCLSTQPSPFPQTWMKLAFRICSAGSGRCCLLAWSSRRSSQQPCWGENPHLFLISENGVEVEFHQLDSPRFCTNAPYLCAYMHDRFSSFYMLQPALLCELFVGVYCCVASLELFAHVTFSSFYML